MSGATAGTGATASSLAQEYRATLKSLLDKQRALEEELAGGTATAQLQYKRAMLREMIRDTRATLRQLDPRPGRGRSGARGSLDGGPLTERYLSYLAWQRRQSMAQDNREALEWMRAVVDDGTAVLTARQRQVLELRYRAGLHQAVIAQSLGVDVSTICRTLQRAEDKLRRYADARTLAARCTRSDGRLDVVGLVRQTCVVTPRQRQALLLALAGLPTWAAARRLGVHPSTVSRTRRRGEWRLYRLVGVYRQGDGRAVDWDETCREMAREYGIGLGAVYKILGALAHSPGSQTLLQRELLRRYTAGSSPGEIARELDLSLPCVRRLLFLERKRRQKELPTAPSPGFC